MLLSLKDNFLNQCMISRDLLTQSLAIEALAQFCILDKEIAQQNLVRFLLMVRDLVFSNIITVIVYKRLTPSISLDFRRW